MRNKLMIKEFTLTLILFIGLALVLIYPHSAAAISLKSNSIVKDDTIKLSDIFAGLPDGREDRVLGPAPRPGQDMVLNARTLMRIAMAMDLPWRPKYNSEQVVLSRSASVVEHDMIKNVLKGEIANSGFDGEYQIAFSGPLSEIILPPEQPASVDVQSIKISKGSNLFDAVLVAPSKDMPLQTIHVSGALHRMTNIPVLRDTMRNGMVIGKRDIDYVPVRQNDVQEHMVINASELIGMTPRRMVLPGKPLNLNDLEAPQIVERGDLVTITINHAGMLLTAQGKALENGAKGDSIRVSNIASSRTVDAIVTSERQVEVRDY